MDESLVLRWFCRPYLDTPPDDTTLFRWTRTLRPETLHQLNGRVVTLAKQAKQVLHHLSHRRTCVEGGIVTRYRILAHPDEHGQATEAVEHHLTLFARPPHLVAGDRGSNPQRRRSASFSRMSSSWRFRPLDLSPKNNGIASGFAHSCAAIDDVQASKAELPAYTVIMDGINVVIASKTGWSGSWGWEW